MPGWAIALVESVGAGILAGVVTYTQTHDWHLALAAALGGAGLKATPTQVIGGTTNAKPN